MKIYVNADNKLVYISNDLEIKILEYLSRIRGPIRQKELVIYLFGDYDQNYRVRVYQVTKSLESKGLVKIVRNEGTYIIPIFKGEAYPAYYSRKLLHFLLLTMSVINMLYILNIIIYNVQFIYIINMIIPIIVMIADFIEKKYMLT